MFEAAGVVFNCFVANVFHAGYVHALVKANLWRCATKIGTFVTQPSKPIKSVKEHIGVCLGNCAAAQFRPHVNGNAPYV